MSGSDSAFAELLQALAVELESHARAWCDLTASILLWWARGA